MATVTKKDKFFEVLRNIFVGAKIEGNSGYVNLMKIKSKYYNEFKEQLHSDIDAKLKEVGQNFEEELYNKLFTFFKKYFSESGSIYFSYTPLQEKVYERIYRDDKDVMLFWKTHMLYYVKTERLFKNMEVEDEDIIYLFDVAELQHKKSNEKKDLVFELVKAEHTDKRRIHFSVKYSANGTKTKTEEIHKKIKKEKAFDSITLKQIEKVFGIFKRQSEVDYFINKDAKGFLKEQFSLWIKGYLLDDETLFESARLNQLKALQKVAFNIIDLVGQFEDELVKVWNKLKFAHSSNYVITLDKIADKDFSLLGKIIKHKGITEQEKEWQELGVIDKKFDSKDILKSKKLTEDCKYLPLDTKYFKNLELEVLFLFDDLDNQIDGWLIHSENYQALNTIRSKFNNKVQTVYIDPPFNLEGSDQFDYRTNYKDTSWLSLLDSRLQLTKQLMNETSTIFVRCDYNGNHIVRHLLNYKFSDENYRNEIIVAKSSKITEKLSKYHNDHDTLFFYSKNNKYKFEAVRIKRDKVGWQPMHLPGIRWSPIDEETAKLCSKENVKIDNGKYKSIARIILGNEYIPPQGRHWALSQDTIFEREKLGTIRIGENGQPESKQEPDIRLTDNWTDIPGYSSTQNFTTENSEKLLERVVLTGSEKGDLVLDYFMGSSTTQAVAHKLGRKWIGSEMGEHFYTVDLPRMKRVLAGYEEGISRTINDFKGGGFFKYYSLEQYEETLSKIKYEDKGTLPTQDIYHQFLFLKDLKLADEVIKLDEKSKSIKVDLTKLHPAIDIPETLSHLTGKFIKQIKKDEVVFTDGTSIDLTNIDYKIVKPLIWW